MRREGTQCALPAPPQQQGREDGGAEQVGVYEHVPQQLVRLQAAPLTRERPLGSPLQHVGEHLLESGQLGLRVPEHVPRQEEDRPQQHEHPPDLAGHATALVHAPSSLRPARLPRGHAVLWHHHTPSLIGRPATSPKPLLRAPPADPSRTAHGPRERPSTRPHVSRPRDALADVSAAGGWWTGGPHVPSRPGVSSRRRSAPGLRARPHRPVVSSDTISLGNSAYAGFCATR